MTTLGELHIRTLLREPQNGEAYHGLYRVMRAARTGSGVSNPLLSEPALRVALVSASDSKFLSFFRRLLNSIPLALRREHLDVCILDVGLSEEDAAALRDQGCQIVRPGWDIEFPGMHEAPTHLKALVARAHLPTHFPGYDVYIYIDADAWVQRISCLDDLVLPALAGAITIVPVISPSYRNSFKLSNGPTISAVEWGRRALRMYFGDRLTKAHGEEPVLNAGVFALRGDAPHWALWAEAFRHGLKRGPGEFFVEQTALNFVVYENELSRHLLPATYNWQTHLSTPMYDPESGLLCEPHLPHEPIKIVHLTGPDKADPKPIRFLDGRTVRQSLAAPIPRDRRPDVERGQSESGSAGPSSKAGQSDAAEPSGASDSPAAGRARESGQGVVITLPHLTQASSRTGQPVKVMTHEQNETLSRFLRIQGVWQRDVSIFIDSVISDGDMFVDLGANIGYFSVLAGAAVRPSGRVHAFEPDPTNFKLLQKNAVLNGLDNIVCHQVAIGEASGRGTLYRSRTNLGAHSLLQDEGLADPLEVRVSALDDALVGESGSITLIKIDLQGADLLALRGMTRLLERQAAKPMIIFEYSSRSFVDQDPDLVEFEGFVRRHGYRLYGFITNTGQSRVPPRLDFAAFRAMNDSFARHGTTAEIDLLLSPGAPEVKRQ